MLQSNAKAYRNLSLLVIAVLIIGMVFYHFVEGLNWIDAYYFCVITLTTVGYGDITPKTEIGKLFTTLYLFVGLGIITTFISVRFKHRAEKIQKLRNRNKKQ